MDGSFVFVLLGAVMLYWVTTIVLLIIGLARLRSRPENAKKLLTLSGVLFIIGGGVCGLLLS
jgi:hypothetical protein